MMLSYKVTVLALVCFVCSEVVFGQQSIGPECNLPRRSGSCNKKNVRFYYDSKAGECKEFIYSGCDGNLNNFFSIERCHSRCVCSQPKREGKGDGNLVRYYYSVQDKRCLRFTYRGSGGNENNFISRRACKNKCSQPPAPEQTCDARPEKGTSCSEKSSIQYYYDKQCDCCRTFRYNGCGGNNNRYPTDESCMASCGRNTSVPSSEPNARPDRCLRQPRYGTCRNDTIRYYYDERMQKCTTFVYSGCDGNRNNFRSMFQCNRKCVQNITGPVGVTFYNRDGQITAQRSGSREVNKFLIESGITFETYNDTLINNETQNPSDSAFTNLLEELGGLNNAEFGVDPVVIDNGPENTNTDVTSLKTATTAATTTTKDPNIPAECLMRPDIGNCIFRVSRFYFDEKFGICRHFIYSGCGGNANRFSSEAQCKSRCIMN